MKKIILTLVLGCQLIIALAQSSTLKKVPINTKNKNPRGYVEYLPKNFDPSGSKKYPVLYWLHGLGEPGNGSSSALDKVYNIQISKWLKTNDVEFIVLIPQDYNAYWGGTPSRIKSFVDWANKEYKNYIDPNQQHMGGLSSGGYGVAVFITENSDTYKAFSTFTPMSTNLNNVNSRAQQIVENDQYVWIHHGTNDKSPNAIGAVMGFHSNISSLDSKRSRLTAYEGMGHSAWEEVYDGSGRSRSQIEGTVSGITYHKWATTDSDWYSWMASHKKTGTTIEAPTAIAIDNYVVNENNAPGLVVGTLSATGSQPLMISLSNSPSSDNEMFTIDNNKLIINESCDFESKNLYNVSVSASNSEGSISENIEIYVNDLNEGSSAPFSVKVNFGRVSSSSEEGWNNLFTNTPMSSIPAWELTDSDGKLTNLSLKITDDFLGTPNTAGPSAGSDPYPENVVQYGWKDRYNGSFDISGLDGTKTYTIKVFGNTSETQALMQCNINDEQVGGSVNVTNNATTSKYEFIKFDVVPTNGKISVRIGGDNSSSRNYGYISALIVEESTGHQSASARLGTPETTQVSSEENPDAARWILFPNPITSGNEINLKAVRDLELLDVTVMGMNGNIISKGAFNRDVSSNETITLNVANVDKGLFYLLVNTVGKQEIFKLIKG